MSNSQWSMSEKLAFGWSVALVTFAIAYIYPGFDVIVAMLRNEHFRAWWQILGPLFAFAGAVYLARRSRMHDRRDKAEKELVEIINRHAGALRLVGGVQAMAGKIIKLADIEWLTPADLQYISMELEGLTDALDVDMLQFDNHATIEGILISRSCAKLLLAAVTGTMADLANSKQFGQVSLAQMKLTAAEHVEAISPRGNAIQVYCEKLHRELALLRGRL